MDVSMSQVLKKVCLEAKPKVDRDMPYHSVSGKWFHCIFNPLGGSPEQRTSTQIMRIQWSANIANASKYSLQS